MISPSNPWGHAGSASASESDNGLRDLETILAPAQDYGVRIGYELLRVDLVSDLEADIRVAGVIGDPALLVRVISSQIQFAAHSLNYPGIAGGSGVKSVERIESFEDTNVR
jgi:hypothetical protein